VNSGEKRPPPGEARIVKRPLNLAASPLGGGIISHQKTTAPYPVGEGKSKAKRLASHQSY